MKKEKMTDMSFERDEKLLVNPARQGTMEEMVEQLREKDEEIEKLMELKQQHEKFEKEKENLLSGLLHFEETIQKEIKESEEKQQEILYE